MSFGLTFQTAAPPAAAATNRNDIACFIGYVARRPGTRLPAAVRQSLVAAGWSGGPWGRSDAALESALQLPIVVESWDVFDRLYAWDARPVAADGALRCATYLGAAVRSFFAAGGRRAIIVRVGDPWPYLGAPNSRASNRAARFANLIPGLRASDDPFDRTDPGTWLGLQHLYGLGEASFVALPDLADICARDPAPPSGEREQPGAPEGFVECSADEPPLPNDNVLARMQAPQLDDAGFEAWRRALVEVRNFLARHRRDALFIGALPQAHRDTNHIEAANTIYAESELLSYLRGTGILEPLDAYESPPSSAASAFLQLGWPWLSTRRSSDLPQTLEAPDGLLCGVIAASALARGTFRSVAGSVLPEVLGATPLPAWGMGADSPAGLLAERFCLIAPEPEGWTLVSDVTTSVDPEWRPGGVSRLVASVLRAARQVGEGLVFEANGPLLWMRLRRAIEQLLSDYWREGGLRGETAEDAYEVRCDRTTMNQNDVDNGRLVAQIRLSPCAAIERITVVLALESGGATVVELREVA
jgi:uncharacterized protein